jgi:hypothetical protein
VLLVDCSRVIYTMAKDGAIDVMVVDVGLINDCRVFSGLLEENIVEEYLHS